MRPSWTVRAAAWALALTLSAPSRASDAEGLQIGAVVDTYLSFDLDRPPDNERPPFLYSYARAGEVNVNLALLRGAWREGAARAQLGLMAGTFPQANQIQEQPLLRHLYEASAGARVAPGLWVDAGLFPSHLGAESAIGPENPTPTRTLLAENSPYYLSGVRGTWEVDGALTVALVVANGWQTVRQPIGRDGIGGGSQVAWAASDRLTLNWSTWVGWEPGPAQTRLFNDLYAVYAAPRVEWIAWVDVGHQAPSTWGGGALLGRVEVVQRAWLGGRIERFGDPANLVLDPATDGATITGGSVHTDIDIAASRGVAWWRTEARLFHADREIFRGGAGSRHLNLAFTSSLQVAL